MPLAYLISWEIHLICWSKVGEALLQFIFIKPQDVDKLIISMP